MEDQLKANQTQTRKQQRARINPEYKRIDGRITYWRRKLKKASPSERKTLIDRLKTLEQERKKTTFYIRDKKHPCKIKYVRYADDWLILVNGPKREAEELKNQVKEKLFQLGLKLSEEKTKITHWRNVVHFLGYNIHGKRSVRSGIKAVLCIPQEKVKKIKEAIAQISSYHHIPEVDAMVQLSTLFRGWCNYYRYANAPQKTFAGLARFLWWQYAHFLARKQKSSIAQMIRRERKAQRLKPIEKNGRKRNTFQQTIGEKPLILDLFSPKTAQIRRITNRQTWEVDLKPITPWNWQSGRSLATRLNALERARGLCERCKERPVEHVHHTVPLKSKSFLARTTSDQAQRYTAMALCKECHLEMHGGSFNPRKQRSSRNAGYAERCSSSVGRAA